MKKLYFIILLGFITLPVFSQNDAEQIALPPNYQVDTRIDNMGYWGRMAQFGLVPVQPMYKPAPAVMTGTKVFTNKGVLITDSPDVPVTVHVNTESENSIAIEFGDKDHILNSNNSTAQPSSGSTYGADWYESFDGGSTFTGSYQGAGGGNSGDPAACINNSGRYFIGYITNGGDQGVSYSDDHGSTWTPVVACPDGTSFNILDKNHLWVDVSPTSPFVGYVYDAWMHTDSQIHVCRSITNGTTYESDFSISNGTNAGSHNQGVNLKTGPDGEVYAAWAVYDSWPSDEKAIGFSKSLDGGVTWSTAIRAINNLKGIRGNGSVTQNMRTNSFPSMACDLSNGPHRGNLYVVWTNKGVPGVNTGSDRDVYMIKSNDKGNTWSAPIRINQNVPDGKDHYLPWITCDQANGYISVVFYDGRNVPSNQAETYVAYSTDGGSTFTDMKVSDVAFTPSPIPNMATGYMGDYLSIAAYDGRIYPTWTDNRLGYCMTYVSPVTLIVPMGFVGVTDNILNDTTYGNGNNRMDYGETELLGLTMKNTGTAEADSVTVTVRPDSPYITMIDSTEFYGNFIIGGSRTIRDAFKFHVSDSIPHGLNVTFEVIARDKNDTAWTTSFVLMSHAPAVTIISKSISDPAPGGNGNGRLDPGETVTMNVLTQNTGDFDAVNAVSELSVTNSYVTIGDPIHNLGTLVPGQQVTVPFIVTVDSTAPFGSAARFTNYAHSQYQHDTKTWVEKIGLIVEDFETNNFTKFAWQFPNIPWSICDSAPQEKLHCGQSGHLTTNGSRSAMTLQYNVLMDDSISFQRRVRSQALVDPLKFYIDGAMVGQWAGSGLAWSYSAFPVLAGPHTFKWEFEKNENKTDNYFAGWLDFIVFPPEYKTSVNSGNNSSVCSGSSIQLHGMASAYDSILWTTSGTGAFTDPRILAPIYTPSPADISLGSVTLTLTAYSALTHDTSSSTLLSIVPPPTANAGGAQEVCAGSAYTTSNASGTNYSLITWSSAGDGTFSDNTLLNTVYTPGTSDILNGHTYLKVSLHSSVTDCAAAVDSLELTINALPVVNLGNDTSICADHPFTLNPGVTDATAWLWHPSGNTTPTLNVDTTGSGMAEQTITVDVTNAKSCQASGTIHISFKDCTGINELRDVSLRIYPNPNNGIFTIEMNALHKEKLDINVVSTSGVTLYSLKDLDIYGAVSRKVDIGNLAEGTYLLTISNGKESTLRKIVIRK